MSEEPKVHYIGIRHHGPGSARSALQALERLQPDIVLIEGPPDAQDLAALASDPEMQPPVALLLYQSNDPSRAVYYPFASFSPEWQALQYAQANNIPSRFIDLPHSIRFALEEKESSEPSVLTPPSDPLAEIAKLDNFDDSECWWDARFESGLTSEDTFEVVLELMTELRQAETRPLSSIEALREAWMRRELRAAEKDSFQSIAVIHGAWHGPALSNRPTAKSDNELLKGLSKVKVDATWIPWTHSRLRYASGYGAGIESPGYYQHLWENKGNADASVRWLTKVARLLREEDLEGSTASVIESTRLADTLAVIRGRSAPGLSEFNEASASVFCFGDTAPLELIRRKLIVGERLGAVPSSAPTVVLQRDLQQLLKSLRLKQAPEETVLELDLRAPTGLERSHLFHRLKILDIHWAEKAQASGKGTFKEMWRLRWEPGYELVLIEASVWGNTIASAATARLVHKATNETSLSALATAANTLFLADLPEAIQPVLKALESLATLTSDAFALIETIPPLAEILRYGDVRQTNTAALELLVRGLVTRSCIGLPPACSSLSDEAAEKAFDLINAMHTAAQGLQDPEIDAQWTDALTRLADDEHIHGNVSGRSTRILFDWAKRDSEALALQISRSLSRAIPPMQAAQWIEGFLKGSGLLLLHNPALWQLIDSWISELNSESFVEQLPVLRRTFSSFPLGERRQMAQLAQRGSSSTPSYSKDDDEDIDANRANQALPTLARFLGLGGEVTLEE